MLFLIFSNINAAKILLNTARVSSYELSVCARNPCEAKGFRLNHSSLMYVLSLGSGYEDRNLTHLLFKYYLCQGQPIKESWLKGQLAPFPLRPSTRADKSNSG